MNKTHAIAKIAVVAFGIYFLIQSLFVFAQTTMFFFMNIRGNQGGYNWVFLIPLIPTLLFMIALYYFLIYQSGKTARKIVGKDDLPDPISPSAWYPFALRLTSVVAGFFSLSRFISISRGLLTSIWFSLQPEGSMRQFYETLGYGLVYLAISIYLLCGAPHFVRWQMRKTREFCSRFSA